MVGRPPIYNTNEDLENKVNEYFEKGVKMKSVLVGKGDNKEVIEIPVPTITGLAYYLGFESRQSFYDYEKYEQFSYTIKRARLFIEKEYEELLQVGNTTGAIFALKNMGWIDKTHSDITTNDKDINPTLSPESISKLIDKL
jgi:hypothetical protein